jgi:aldehyde:ferredoxin oxidoreductase
VAENGLSDVHRDPGIPLVWNGEKSAHANAVIARFIHLRGCIKDSLTLCDWLFPVMTSGREDREYMGDLSVEHELLTLVTGEKTDQEELDRRAARIWNLHRLLTALEWEGGRPADLRETHDQIPDHYFHRAEALLLSPFPPSKKPHPPLDRERFEATKTAYYRCMGWDVRTGLPRRSTLQALGMKDVADRFETLAFKLPG